jgi:hypothetical protein
MNDPTTRGLGRYLLRSALAALITTTFGCATMPPSRGTSWPTQLQMPIAQYLAQPAALENVANRGEWDVGERAPRPACIQWPCATANATADMQIDAVLNARNYDQSRVGLHGTVVARIRNRGTTGVDRAFGARPGATVYVIAHRWHSEFVAHAELVEVWSDASGQHARHLGYGEYRSCLHPDSNLPPPVARFGGCTPSGTPHRMPRRGGPAAAFDIEAPPGGSGDGQTPCSPGGCCAVLWANLRRRSSASRR